MFLFFVFFFLFLGKFSGLGSSRLLPSFLGAGWTAHEMQSIKGRSTGTERVKSISEFFK